MTCDWFRREEEADAEACRMLHAECNQHYKPPAWAPPNYRRPKLDAHECCENCLWPVRVEKVLRGGFLAVARSGLQTWLEDYGQLPGADLVGQAVDVLPVDDIDLSFDTCAVYPETRLGCLDARVCDDWFSREEDQI